MQFLLFKYFQMFCSKFYTILLNHIYILFTDLDPVKNAKRYRISRDHLLRFRFQPNEVQSKVNFNFGKQNRLDYLIPLFTMSYLAVSDLINIIIAYLNFDHKEDSRFHISKVPKLLAHWVFPQETWLQADVMMILGMLMILSIYFCLIFTPHYEFIWLMFRFDNENGRKIDIIQNGRFLEQKETVRIAKLQAKVKQVLPIVATAVLALVGLYVLNNFFNNFNNQKSYTFQDYIHFGVISIPFVPYMIFTNFFVIYFFILSCQYLRVKQKCTMEQLSSLEKREFSSSSSKVSNNFWNLFKKLNSITWTFQKKIASYNRFWSKYLSIYFLVYMMEICYLSYCFFFLSTTADLTSYVLILAAGNFVIILFYITLQCSKIDSARETVHRQTMRMAIRRFVKNDGKKEFLKNLFEVEQKAAEHADQCGETFYSFTLVTGHKINSAMFETVALQTLMFFMIVFKESENIQ